jgi:hypothetical protein
VQDPGDGQEGDGGLRVGPAGEEGGKSRRLAAGVGTEGLGGEACAIQREMGLQERRRSWGMG